MSPKPGAVQRRRRDSRFIGSPMCAMASHASPFASLNGPRSLVSAPTPLTMRTTGWTPSCPPTCSKASLESTAAAVRRRTRSSRHRGACRVSTTCGAAEPDNDSFLDGYLRVLRKHKPGEAVSSVRIYIIHRHAAGGQGRQGGFMARQGTGLHTELSGLVPTENACHLQNPLAPHPFVYSQAQFPLQSW